MNQVSIVPFAVLALAAGHAFAQSTSEPVDAVPMGDTRLAPPALVADADRRPDAIDRLCLRETGTMIRARRAAASRERCPSHQFGRVYTQDDLRSTGQVDIAQALRMLDPSIR